MYYDFSQYLKVSRQRGEEVYGKCPLHNDHNPSFSGNIKTGLWKCHAGCGSGDFNFLEALLEGVIGPLASEFQKNENQVIQSSAPSLHTDFRKIAEYIYVNATFEISLKVVRLENIKGEKKFFQQSYAAGQWVSQGYKGDLAPYQYQNWARKHGALFLVEGEKCAEYLEALGLDSTTTPGGANNWKDSFARFFSGRNVIILPDNDLPGKRYSEEAYKSLSPVTASVRIVVLPNLAPSEDVVDWMKGGGSVDGLFEFINNPIKNR